MYFESDLELTGNAMEFRTRHGHPNDTELKQVIWPFSCFYSAIFSNDL